MSTLLEPVAPTATTPRHAADEPSPFQMARHFPALDGLRALSILAVLYHHTMDSSGPWGYMGVALFFAISGFLITTLLLREQERTGGIALGHFYVRRTLRIFPLYYAVLALYVALVIVTDRRSVAGQQFFANLPAFATYTSNWFVAAEGTRTIFYFAWSLAAEEQFYLFWPSVMRAGIRRRTLPALVMTSVLVASLIVGRGHDHGFQSAALWQRIVASVPTAICLGCLAAIAAHAPRGERIFARLLGARWTSLALIGAAIAMVAWRAPSLLTYVVLTAVVVSTCIRPSETAPLLTWRWLRAIGVVSYGMYLFQMLCANVMKRALPSVERWPLVFFVATGVLTFAVAKTSHAVFERPFLRLKERFR